MSSAIILYPAAGILLLLSFLSDRQRTRKALKKAFKSGMALLPKMLAVMIVIGISLALIKPEMLSKLIGDESGWLGTIGAALIGAITLIPGFVAFPTAKMLLDQGAGYLQIGTFISTLMMVGVLTFPVEREYFGTKTTLVRNGIALIFSFVVGYAIFLVVNHG